MALYNLRLTLEPFLPIGDADQLLMTAKQLEGYHYDLKQDDIVDFTIVTWAT